MGLIIVYMLDINIDWTIVIVCVVAIFIMAAIGYYTDCNRDMGEVREQPKPKKEKTKEKNKEKDLPPTYHYEETSVKEEDLTPALTVLAKEDFDHHEDMIDATDLYDDVLNDTDKEDDFEKLIKENFFMDEEAVDDEDEVLVALDKLGESSEEKEEPTEEPKEKSSRERLDVDDIFKL